MTHRVSARARPHAAPRRCLACGELVRQPRVKGNGIIIPSIYAMHPNCWWAMMSEHEQQMRELYPHG